MTIKTIPWSNNQADIALCLAEQGYAVVEQFLSVPTVAALALEAQERFANQTMQHAGTGKSAVSNREIRGDYIAWLDELETNPAVVQYFTQMHSLRQALNQVLYMGLQSLEAHLAIYPSGSAYQKHLDQFNLPNSLNTRQVSAVLYLNQDWKIGHGGALRMYLDEHYQDILPVSGRLVLFLSAQFWHEVLPATRERISLTGWFRTRELQLV